MKRSVPPPTLVKMGNPLVRMLLGSPLHGVLDHSFLVLHLTGRRYDSVAVSYQAMIDRMGWKMARRQLCISLPGGAARRTAADAPGTQRCGR